MFRATELGQLYMVTHADKSKAGGYRVSQMLRELTGAAAAERERQGPCPALQETTRISGETVAPLGYSQRGESCPFTVGHSNGRAKDGMPNCHACKLLWREDRVAYEQAIYEKGVVVYGD